MDKSEPRQRSYLFTLRMWPEDVGNGLTEWRGKVGYVLSGEAWYFRDWATLIAHLQAMLAEAEINRDQHGRTGGQ